MEGHKATQCLNYRKGSREFLSFVPDIPIPKNNFLSDGFYMFLPNHILLDVNSILNSLFPSFLFPTPSSQAHPLIITLQTIVECWLAGSIYRSSNELVVLKVWSTKFRAFPRQFVKKTLGLKLLLQYFSDFIC